MAHTITPDDHPPPLTEDGFSYSYQKGFTYDGIIRIHSYELRSSFGFDDADQIASELEGLDKAEIIDKLRLYSIPLKESDTIAKLKTLYIEDRMRHVERMKKKGREMTKKELVAQLKLYGVEFNGRLGVGKLREVLVESIRDGKCNKATKAVMELESRLQSEYRIRDRAEIIRIAQERQEAFNNKYPDPKTAAEKDAKLFISRYFLTYDGRPDRSKTKHPIVVTSLTQIISARIQAAVLILLKGQNHYSENFLNCIEDGPVNGEKAVAIGWNKAAVTEALRKAVKPLYEKQEADDKLREEQLMARHHKFVAGLSRDRIPSNLKNIQGSYLVTCKEIQEQWPDDVRRCRGMKMRVIPEVGNLRRNLVADFHFGVMEGLMRFRLEGIHPAQRWPKSETPKPPQTETQPEKSTDSGRAVSKPPAEEKNGEGDRKKEGEENPEKKGEEANSENLKPKHICSPSTCGLKRKTSFLPISPSKRLRGTHDPDEPDPTKFRLAFSLRARDTVESDLAYGTGWIEWDKIDCTTFKGEFNVGFIGVRIPFFGYKTESLVKGMKPCSQWADYSDDPYDNRQFARLFR